jgi:hypothetical protein
MIGYHALAKGFKRFYLMMKKQSIAQSAWYHYQRFFHEQVFSYLRPIKELPPPSGGQGFFRNVFQER